ncbi:hypothetical protein HY031_03060, partial [Candidatus Gottesmanbacteria bacterium]|nr:hypothetical protein [Candidatus Gottesmanbacteria bacterium]
PWVQAGTWLNEHTNGNVLAGRLRAQEGVAQWQKEGPSVDAGYKVASGWTMQGAQLVGEGFALATGLGTGVKLAGEVLTWRTTVTVGSTMLSAKMTGDSLAQTARVCYGIDSVDQGLSCAGSGAMTFVAGASFLQGAQQVGLLWENANTVAAVSRASTKAVQYGVEEATVQKGVQKSIQVIGDQSLVGKSFLQSEVFNRVLGVGQVIAFGIPAGEACSKSDWGNCLLNGSMALLGGYRAIAPITFGATPETKVVEGADKLVNVSYAGSACLPQLFKGQVPDQNCLTALTVAGFALGPKGASETRPELGEGPREHLATVEDLALQLRTKGDGETITIDGVPRPIDSALRLDVATRLREAMFAVGFAEGNALAIKLPGGDKSLWTNAEKDLSVALDAFRVERAKSTIDPKALDQATTIVLEAQAKVAAERGALQSVPVGRTERTKVQGELDKLTSLQEEFKALTKENLASFTDAQRVEHAARYDATIEQITIVKEEIAVKLYTDIQRAVYDKLQPALNDLAKEDNVRQMAEDELIKATHPDTLADVQAKQRQYIDRLGRVVDELGAAGSDSFTLKALERAKQRLALAQERLANLDRLQLTPTSRGIAQIWTDVLNERVTYQKVEVGVRGLELELSYTNSLRYKIVQALNLRGPLAERLGFFSTPEAIAAWAGKQVGISLAAAQPGAPTTAEAQPATRKSTLGERITNVVLGTPEKPSPFWNILERVGIGPSNERTFSSLSRSYAAQSVDYRSEVTGLKFVDADGKPTGKILGIQNDATGEVSPIAADSLDSLTRGLKDTGAKDGTRFTLLLTDAEGNPHSVDVLFRDGKIYFDHQTKLSARGVVELPDLFLTRSRLYTTGEGTIPLAQRRLVTSINDALGRFEEQAFGTLENGKRVGGSLRNQNALSGRGLEAGIRDQSRVILDAMLKAAPGEKGILFEAVTSSGKSSVMLPEITYLKATFGDKVTTLLNTKGDLNKYIAEYVDINAVTGGRKIESISDLTVEELRKIESKLTDVYGGKKVVIYDGDPNHTRTLAEVGAADIIYTTKEIIFESLKAGDPIAEALATRGGVLGGKIADKAIQDRLYRELLENSIPSDKKASLQPLVDEVFRDPIQIDAKLRRFIDGELGVSSVSREDILAIREQFRARKSAADSIVSQLSRTPEVEIRLGQTGESVGHAVLAENSAVSGKSPQRMFDALALEFVGGKMVRDNNLTEGRGLVIDLNQVAVSGEAKGTNYAQFLKGFRQVYAFTGTPRPIAEAYKVVYGIDLGVSDVNQVDLVLKSGAPHELKNVVQTSGIGDLANGLNARRGTAGFPRDAAVENIVIATELHSRTEILAQIHNSSPGQDVVLRRAGGDAVVLRFNDTTHLFDEIEQLAGAKEVNAKLDSYRQAGTKVTQVYEYGAHYGTDVATKVNEPFTVVIGPDTTETDFLQGAGRDRAVSGKFSYLDTVTVGVRERIAGSPAEQIAALRTNLDIAEGNYINDKIIRAAGRSYEV